MTMAGLQTGPDRWLTSYDPVERGAILDHKYFLGIEMGFDPGLLCAIESWEARYAADWRRRRLAADWAAQWIEIERYRDELARSGHREITLEDAARGWIASYAADWRRRRTDQAST
ncbi:MAG: hypothetical protein GX591_00195 [Planctomycetes bacterium]|nr:hypothetical protein [Planctomycetota bacterium]